ncbi:hypothetical protein CYLTODRAFT_424680 [Cylindrobasidium torrendii FP15055 ss-10]|uniref:37S ribosomal protein mrp10, mitochondrial n=1 Tax=Cylindrobasidium torrendii FP15055 ss-10 TaxID=1314674 RepID=A0A0D7B365_9AGAR|nr:hypothetical protein CYLTODRAFT_424680 [Cylindrobasidium torrendii FP15055 ss-10]
MVHIKELKVRPKKRTMYGMCSMQFMGLLGCWSASKDLQSTGACKLAAESLLLCMRTTVPEGRKPRPAINYHLSRLRKRLQ